MEYDFDITLEQASFDQACREAAATTNASISSQGKEYDLIEIKFKTLTIVMDMGGSPYYKYDFTAEYTFY